MSDTFPCDICRNLNPERHRLPADFPGVVVYDDEKLDPEMLDHMERVHGAVV